MLALMATVINQRKNTMVSAVTPSPQDIKEEALEFELGLGPFLIPFQSSDA